MINKNSQPISNENNRIKKITAILAIINALFINVGNYFELFSSNKIYVSLTLSIIITFIIMYLSIKHKLVSWKIFFIYGSIAIAFLLLQSI